MEFIREDNGVPLSVDEGLFYVILCVNWWRGMAWI